MYKRQFTVYIYLSVLIKLLNYQVFYRREMIFYHLKLEKNVNVKNRKWKMLNPGMLLRSSSP